jgi:hypothetical protein
MNRLNPHLDAALQRVRTAVEQAAERGAEGMGLAALSAGQAKRRDALLSAQFLFRKQQALFSQRFDQSMRQQLDESPAPAAKSGGGWGELSLMDDEQVNAMVAADRIGLALGHQSEWELREVDAYMGGLASPGQEDRHPLRPQVIAQALLAGIHAVTEDSEARQLLTDELTRALAQEMRTCYADIAQLFRSRGLRPQDLRVRATESARGGHSGRGLRGGEFAASSHSQHAPLGESRHGDLRSQPGGLGGAFGGGGSGYGAAPLDPQLVDLLRRLAQSPVIPAGSTAAHPGSAPGMASISQWQAWEGDTAGGHEFALPANLIHLHRDELRQAATGNLDHMVIDVVAGLFDQILSDPKLPPQMAQQIARLQLPVLRAALSDRSFFSSRRHPVRRLVNRIASLACAYDDFSEEPGRAFLTRVRELVQELVGGDFERMDLYESQLDGLEQFVAQQSAQTLKAQGDAAALVERKETELRLQQRYMQQLQQAMASLELKPFLRDFLTRNWSEVLVQASRRQPVDTQQMERLRRVGQDLVLSVQPKTGPSQRQAFLASLPVLMRSLNEGLDLIRWPEPQRKAFFAELLPAHAESLKGQALSALEYNLLAKQLETVFGIAPPQEQDLPPGEPASQEVDLDLSERLSDAEAKHLGLVADTQVDWDGQLDIDLSAEDQTPLQAVDISIDGLPAAEEAPEPASGELLIAHLQLGIAYQMHLEGQWVKVRLAHISAGRSFFIFTHGSKHQETLTMTARMLRKMCEGGRLKAYEHAHLLERATARARKQLAALNSKL